jgi:bacteriocin-like protein
MRATLLSQPSNTELSEEELAQVSGGIFRYAGGAGNENGALIPPLQAGVFSSNGIKVWEAGNWQSVHAWR